MRNWLRLVRAGGVLELQHLQRSPLFVALTLLQAITFLILISLFGLTGSHAPTALIDRDGSKYSRQFIDSLRAAHNSFHLMAMSPKKANAALRDVSIVAIVTIPPDFGRTVSQGRTAEIRADVDNVDTDLTDDIQRALPSAISIFVRREHFPGIRVRPVEHDLLTRDTGYIPYLVVSALVLDALVVAGVLSATAIAREWEDGTVTFWQYSPARPLALLAGKLAATIALSCVAVLLTALVVVFAYGVVPVHPVQVGLTLAACIILFSAVGAAIGVMLRRALPATALIFGLSFPLYYASGALEPARFDGEPIWIAAHFTPAYYAVGVLQSAFHGLNVTPEPVSVNVLAMAGWIVLAVAGTAGLLRRSIG